MTLCKLKRFLLYTTGVVLILLNTSCATFSDTVRDHATGAQLTIQYATLKVIEQSSEPEARANRIRNVINSARVLVDTRAATTLEAVDSAVRAQIDWHSLDPSEKLVVSTLIEVVRQELAERIDDAELAPDELVYVVQVFDWIDDAVTMSGY